MRNTTKQNINTLENLSFIQQINYLHLKIAIHDLDRILYWLSIKAAKNIDNNQMFLYLTKMWFVVLACYKSANPKTPNYKKFKQICLSAQQSLILYSNILNIYESYKVIRVLRVFSVFKVLRVLSTSTD